MDAMFFAARKSSTVERLFLRHLSGISLKFLIKILSHERLDGFLEAFVHGLSRWALHAGNMIEVWRVLNGENLLATLCVVERERVLNAVRELELLPDHSFLHGVGMHGAVAEPLLVGIEQGAVIVEQLHAAEVRPAEVSPDGLRFVVMDDAARGTLFGADCEHRAVLFQHLPVLRGKIGKDAVQMFLDLPGFLLGHNAGPVAALGLAAVFLNVAGIAPGKDFRIH
jgi:hypothetical protein